METENSSPKTPLRFDPNWQEKGVLLSDQIAFYAQEYDLIEPFCVEALRPAGYCLHVGEEFMIAGQRYNFEKQKLNDFSIEPYEVAVIKIKEKICLPRFLIGRWDIRVTHAYRGLMWVGGAQVDPGFKGHLYCPIYNLSNRPVRLRRGDELAVIDFVKTTPFREAGKHAISFDTEKYADRDFFDYEAQQLESALIKQADEIQDVKAQAKSVDTRMTWFITIVVSLLGLLGASRFFDQTLFPPLDWKFALGVFALVFIVAKVAVSFTLPSTAAGIRWSMRVLRISPGASSRFHLLWFFSLGPITIALVIGLLYVILGNPIWELRKQGKDLDRRVDQIEQVLGQIQVEVE